MPFWLVQLLQVRVGFGRKALTAPKPWASPHTGVTGRAPLGCSSALGLGIPHGCSGMCSKMLSAQSRQVALNQECNKGTAESVGAKFWGGRVSQGSVIHSPALAQRGQYRTSNLLALSPVQKWVKATGRG